MTVGAHSMLPNVTVLTKGVLTWIDFSIYQRYARWWSSCCCVPCYICPPEVLLGCSLGSGGMAPMDIHCPLQNVVSIRIQYQYTLSRPTVYMVANHKHIERKYIIAIYCIFYCHIRITLIRIQTQKQVVPKMPSQEVLTQMWLIPHICIMCWPCREIHVCACWWG